MKKLLMMVIMMMSLSLFAGYPFSNIKKTEEIVQLANETDLLIEGKVVGIESVIKHRKENYIMSPEEVTTENAGKIVVVTKFTFEVIEKFKDNVNETNKLIEVWIPGGIFYVDGVEYFQGRSESAFANLEEGDILILGLVANNSDNIIFNTGYKLYKNSSQLQIPSSDKMIDEVETGELEKAKKRIYKEKLKSLSKQDDKEYPAFQDLEYNLWEASVKKVEKVNEKKNFVKELKKAFRREYE